MAYDQRLAQRVARALDECPELGPSRAVVEKRMFGGIGYMVEGSMACGVIADTLIVRVGRAAYEDALAAPYTRPFDMTGRPMTGWVVVTPAGVARDEDLAAWVARGVAFVLTLPAR